MTPIEIVQISGQEIEVVEVAAQGLPGIPGPQGEAADHSQMQNLDSDDHPQYHNDERGDERYYTKTQSDDLLDNAGAYDNQNVIVGANTPKSGASGIGAFARNVIVGFSSMISATADTTHNVTHGSYTLRDLIKGVLNTAIGTDVMTYLIEGSWNSGWGAKALRYLIYGNHNTAGGHNSFPNLLEGNRNTGYGQGSGNSQLYGDENLFLGYLAGKLSRDGSRNIVVGNNSGFSSFITNSASDVVLIGNNIDADPTKSNFLNICNVIKAETGATKKLGAFGNAPIEKPVVTDLLSFAQGLDALGWIDLQVANPSLFNLAGLMTVGGEGAEIESGIVYGGGGADNSETSFYGGGSALN